MSFAVTNIDNITELKSEIQYIKRFIARVTGMENGTEIEFYVFFSLEFQPLGGPVVSLKFIDSPSEEVKSAEQDIVNRILEMEKLKTLEHSPFNGL